MIQLIFSKCHFVCERRNESGRQRISETEDRYWHIHFQTSSFIDKKILDFMQETHCRTDHYCGVAATHSSIATPPGGWQYCRNGDNNTLHGTKSFLMLDKWTRPLVQQFRLLSLATYKKISLDTTATLINEQKNRGSTVTVLLTTNKSLF